MPDLYRIAVVAHLARAEQAHALQESVGAAFLHMDNGTHGVEASHRRCWEYLATQDTTWSVVIEDDAEPVQDFTNQLEQVLAAAPTDVVSLYLGTGRPVWFQPQGQPHARRLQPLLRDAVAKAEIQGASFILAPQLFHGVAVAIKTTLVPSMLDLTADSTRPIDYRISDWCEEKQISVAYTSPSIVEHLDGPPVAVHPDREPRLQPRKAYRLGGRGHWDGTRVVELDPQ